MAETTGLQTTDEQLKDKTTKVAEKVRAWWAIAKSARNVKDGKLLEQYKIYRFTGKDTKFPWRSNIYVPMGNVNVEIKTAKMLTAILASDPFFRSRARSARFMMNEEVVEQLMLQQLEEMGWPKILHGFIKNHYIFSTAILKGYWKYEEVVEEVEEVEMRPVYVKIGEELMQVDEEPVVKKVKKPRVIFDGPCFEVCNIFDVYWDPKATTLKNARWAIHRKEVTVDHLQMMADKGVYDQGEVNKIKSERAAGTSHDSGEKIEIENIDDENMNNSSTDPIEILECWTKTRKIVVGPNNEVLQDIPNPYPRIPMFELSHLPDPHRLFGTGVNEPVTTVQHHYNKVHRLHFDNWEIHVHKMYLVSEDAVKHPGDLIARPGGYIRIKAGRPLRESVDELSKQPLPIESQMMMDTLERLNETATGVNEPAKGIERRSGKTETATKTRMSAEGASTRFGVELILVEPVIKEILEFMHTMNQTFLTVPRVVRVIGEQGRFYPLVGKENVAGEFDFQFELAPVQGNKEVWLQRLMLVFQQLMQNPMLAPATNWMEMGKRLLKASDIRNPDMILNPQNMMQNMAMMMAAQGPPPGQGGETGPATNPQAGALNAQQRTPQPTPRDSYRDIFAQV